MDKKIFLFLFQKAQGQARGGKYYKREWKNNRWKYWYTKEQYEKDKKGETKPEPKKSIWAKVGAFFGVKSEKEIVQRVKKDYENSKTEMEQEVGKPVAFETFKNHLAEYFANKEKWDKRFAPKAKKDPPPPKEETTPDTIPTEETELPPETPSEPKESTKEKIQSKAEEFKDSQKWDSRLMRFLAGKYSFNQEKAMSELKEKLQERSAKEKAIPQSQHDASYQKQMDELKTAKSKKEFDAKFNELLMSSKHTDLPVAMQHQWAEEAEKFGEKFEDSDNFGTMPEGEAKEEAKDNSVPRTRDDYKIIIENGDYIVKGPGMFGEDAEWVGATKSSGLSEEKRQAEAEKLIDKVIGRHKTMLDAGFTDYSEYFEYSNNKLKQERENARKAEEDAIKQKESDLDRAMGEFSNPEYYDSLDSKNKALIRNLIGKKNFRLPDGSAGSVMDILNKGLFESVSEENVPKYQYNRSKFNRLAGKEQEDYENKLKERKQEYILKIKGGKGGYPIPKRIFDLLNKPNGTEKAKAISAIESLKTKDLADDKLKEKFKKKFSNVASPEDMDLINELSIEELAERHLEGMENVASNTSDRESKNTQRIVQKNLKEAREFKELVESKKKSPDIKKKNSPSPTGGENIPIDLSKMQKIKMPKDIKSKGIDSKEYKEWVQENWAKDTSPVGGAKTSDKLKEVPASDITTIEQYTDEKHYNRKVIDGIKDSIVAKGFDPGSPLKVDRDKNGKLRVVDGHHRFTAVQELIKEGKLPSDTPIYVIEEKFDSEADRLLAQVSANKNKRKPERLDDAKAYSQLIEQGKSIQEISQVTGESPEYVRGTLALNNLSDDFKRLLRSDDKQNRVKSKGDGSDTKMESIGEPLAIVLGKHGINDDGTPNETIQRKAYMWYVANKHKGITVPQVKSYIDTIKNQQSLGMSGVDESGRNDIEKEALRLVGSEEAAKADSLSFENFLNQIQKPIQKFLGDTVTDLDEKKTGKLAASIIASKGSSALESELGKISEALNNLNLFKDMLSKKFKEIQSDSQTPLMFGA